MAEARLRRGLGCKNFKKTGIRRDPTTPIVFRRAVIVPAVAFRRVSVPAK